MTRSSRTGFVLAAVAAALLVTVRPALADLIPTAAVSEMAPTPAASDSAAARLGQLGLSQPEIDARLAQLTPEDLAQVSAHPEQAQLAGIMWWGVVAIAAGIVLLGLLFWWLLEVHEKHG